MLFVRTINAIAILLFFSFTAVAQQRITTDVLVIGGGTSGTAAGLQSSRMGVKTLIVEETVWLGGMLTAAGVSATDGNHLLASGIWKEFRQRIYDYYRGPAKVATGWVSNTHFEPHIADSIFKSMVAAEKNLSVLYGHQFVEVIRKGNRVLGARFLNLTNKSSVLIKASQVIDATELGDAMANAGVAFDVGMEASSITGENVSIKESNNIIQDLTLVAVLKDYGKGIDCTIARPVGYDPREFDGACLDYYNDAARIKPGVDCAKMLNYAKLPGKKYMLNWPAYGNDIYLDIINLTPAQRQIELQKARQQTLRYIYFLQNELGYRHLGLADDEFPTSDRLALIPYHREGRRAKGLVRFKLQHISDPFNEGHPLYRTGIAVGDYPVDQHHRKNPMSPQHLSFLPIPSFNVPLGALISDTHDGLIFAEKAISVSNVVNGSTRLQPCVLLIGQAAGALAALTAKNNYRNGSEVPVRKVQEALLESRAYLMPYADVPPNHPQFLPIQRIGAVGLLRGTGQPNAWANRTWFYPDSAISVQTFLLGIPSFLKGSKVVFSNIDTTNELSMKMLLNWLQKISESNVSTDVVKLSNQKLPNVAEQVKLNWKKWGLRDDNPDRILSRAEIAVLIDQLLDPFYRYSIDHKGNFIYN